MIGGINETSSESFSCSVTFADTEPLVRPGAAVLNNQLYYCGGFDTDKIDDTDKCFKNDGGNWVAVPSMNDPKFSHTMTSVGSYILVTGGYSYNKEEASIAPLDTVEIFDGAVWIKLSYKLSSLRENHCAVPVSNTEILVIGGSFDSKTLVAEKYNIFTGEMTSIPSSSDERYAHACALFNGEVYVSGGALTKEKILSSVEVLNLKTLTWRTISPMNTIRRDHTMEVVNGVLTVFGGVKSYDGDEFDTIEKLIGTTWQTQTETLKLARGNHASAVVDC